MEKHNHLQSQSMLPSQRGKEFETIAAKYLEKHGLKLVTRNFTAPCGELDLIMHTPEMLVFVEVRYRKNSYYGDGAESITQTKQIRLKKTALSFLKQYPKFHTWPCRFDVVSVSGSFPYQITWIPNAIVT